MRLEKKSNQVPEVHVTVRIIPHASDEVGNIKIFAGKIPPSGWLFCDGSLLQIREYPALHRVVGNIYGGDGELTFKLPDLRGRVPVGTGKGDGLSDRHLGQTFGSEEVTIHLKNMPISSSSNVRPIGKMPNYSVSSTDPAPLNNIQPSLALNFIVFAGD